MDAFGSSYSPNSTREPGIGIGNCKNSSSGTDWTYIANAKSYSVRNLYVLVRPKDRSESSQDGPGFLLHPQSVNTMINREVTLNAYAPNVDHYQWRKNGIPLRMENSPWLKVETGHCASDLYDVIAYTADGAATLSAPARVRVIGPNTTILFQ